MYGASIRMASELLLRSDLDFQELVKARFIRFNAAVFARNRTLVVDDFTEIWLAGSDDERVFHLRKGMVVSLAAVKEPTFTDVFTDLAMLTFLPERVVEFFQIKIKELELLKHIKEM